VTPAAFPAEQLEASSGESSIHLEWDFLRTAISGSSVGTLDRLRSLSQGVRWSVLFPLAERHGVQPLLHQSLSRIEQLVPAADMRVLAQLYQANLHRSMLLAREFIHLLDHLAEKHIEVLPYKGLALAEQMYGDVALRQTGDIDLLIHAKDLPATRDAVRELGYVPHISLAPAEERAILNSGYECVFDGRTAPNVLEVQWGILAKFYSVDFHHDEFFRRAVSIKVAGHAMRTPSPEDLFLILSVHAAKHVWGRLIWLCDLARIMASPQLKWEWIAEQAENLGIARILRVTLLLLNRLLHVEIPVRAEASVPLDSHAAMLAREIEASIVAATEYDVESFAYFRLMLRLRERRRDQMRFISRLALTPGPGEWNSVRLPAKLFPLFRVVRLWRLAGKLATR
jgi:hypothetical protein